MREIIYVILRDRNRDSLAHSVLDQGVTLDVVTDRHNIPAW